MLGDISQGNQEFQPALPARGATRFRVGGLGDTQFQPALPARGATTPAPAAQAHGRDFNPRSPRGERYKPLHIEADTISISTRAPREGSDRYGIRIREV